MSSLSLYFHFPWQITKKTVDNFDRDKMPPQCSFKIFWNDLPNQLKPYNQEIKLSGARRPRSITVFCTIGKFSHPTCEVIECNAFF